MLYFFNLSNIHFICYFLLLSLVNLSFVFLLIQNKNRLVYH